MCTSPAPRALVTTQVYEADFTLLAKGSGEDQCFR